MLFKAKNIALLIPVYITVTAVFSGCKKEDKPGPITGPVTNTEINTWIKDSLDRYYYWADKLPANINKNQEPIPYFNSLKNSADRFSFITLPGGGSSLPATSRSKYGFDYLVFKEPVSNRVLGLVTLVMNTSPAKGAGLRRGQYFTKVNGTQLTETNSDEVKDQILSQAAVKLSLATVEGNTVTETGPANINAGETFEQTAVQNVFTAGSKKIAYLFLTGYVDADREAYLTVFADYKAAGVTDMILDLRYNSGGDVSAAAAMCSMLAPGITAATPFIEYRGNKNGGTRKETFSVAATAHNGPAFASLQQHNLNLSKLYVLTTGATASAAELVINNLKPYMTVIQIGQATRGKDEASIAISDKRGIKRVNWVMYPIVYKIFNALGSGGYSNGIAPDDLVTETAGLPLQNFGNQADPMIGYTVDLISGSAALSKKAAKLKINLVRQPGIYNSAVESANALPLLK